MCILCKNFMKYSFKGVIILLKFRKTNVLTVVSCAAMSLQHGSSLADRGYPVDTTVRFECSRGYDLSGSASTTCETSGLWSQPTPTCSQGEINEIYVVRVSHAPKAISLAQKVSKVFVYTKFQIIFL